MLSTKRLLLFASLSLFLLSIATANATADSKNTTAQSTTGYKLILTFQDASVEICNYTDFSFGFNSEIDMQVTSCLPDEIFQSGFEQTPHKPRDNSGTQ